MTGRAFKQRRWLVGALALVIFFAAVGFLAYENFLVRVIPVYADDEKNFKYGSIGNDGATGVPYAIWRVLPEIFPEYLPGPDGYASLGFRWEPGHTQSDAPVGFSRARVGVERMAINCAFCHVTTYRRTPEGPLEFVAAGGGTTDELLCC